MSSPPDFGSFVPDGHFDVDEFTPLDADGDTNMEAGPSNANHAEPHPPVAEPNPVPQHEHEHEPGQVDAPQLHHPVSSCRSTLPPSPPFNWAGEGDPFWRRRPPPFIRVRSLGHILARLGMTEDEALAMGSRYTNSFIDALERGEWRQFMPPAPVYAADPRVKDERRSATPEPRAAGAYHDVPPVKREPRSPTPEVKQERGVHVKAEPASPKAKAERSSPKVKQEPTSPKVKQEPTSPKVKTEPATTPEPEPEPAPARTPGEIITAAARRAALEITAAILSGNWGQISALTMALNIVHAVLNEYVPPLPSQLTQTRRDDARRPGTQRTFEKWMRKRIRAIKAAFDDVSGILYLWKGDRADSVQAATFPVPQCTFDDAKYLCLVALEATFCPLRDSPAGWPGYAHREFDVARLGRYAV